MLKIENITKKFEGLVALNDVSFELEKGQIMGLVGPNGAGKSTLLNVISGLHEPESGKVLFKEEDITNEPPHRICRRGIAKTFQLVQSFPEMSAFENVAVGSLFGGPREQNKKEAFKRAKKELEFVGFPREKFHTPVRNLNVVELRFIQLARALSTQPDLLLLDEVSTGLNPSESKKAIKLIEKIRDRGMTILLVEHVMGVIMNLSDQIVVLHHGEKLAQGTPQEIGADESVIKAYLGKEYSQV